MSEPSRDARPPRPRILFEGNARRVRAPVVLAALVFATLVVSGYALRVELNEAERNEQDLARQAATATTVLLTQTVASLQGARGLVDELGYVDPDGFDAFARPLLGAPGLSSISLVRVVPLAQRELFELEIEKRITSFTPGRGTKVAPRRPFYYAVERIAPRSARQTVGSDLRSEPTLAAAAEDALLKGKTGLTAPLRLIESGRHGFLAISPLFRRYARTATRQQRAQALAGFVVATYEGAGLVEAVLSQLPEGTTLRMTDAGQSIAGPTPALDEGTTSTIEAGGRRWAVEVVDPSGVDLKTPLGLLAGGLALTALVALLYAQSAGRERELEAAAQRVERAQRRTAALQTATSALSGAATAAEVLEVAFEKALPPLGATRSSVWLLGSDGGTLELARAAGFEPEEQERLANVALSSPLVLSHAVRELEPVFVRNREEWRRRFPESAASARDEHRAIAAIPLLDRRQAIGVLALVFGADQEFPEEDGAFMVAVGRQIAQALERARLSDAEHQLAVSLQHSLLPRRLPELAGVAIAARYRPSVQRVNLGGDWYDAIELGEGRLGIGVGDVVGHGPQAAAVMGQLRSALRAIAREHDEPEEVVEGLSRFAETIPEALGTTLVYGVIDLEEETLRYVCAGHPPPLLLRPDGPPEFLNEGRSLPLGVGLGAYRGATAELPPGAILLLYSDGAIERRGEPLDGGLNRLVEAAAGLSEHSVEGACSQLVETLFADREQEDDVALLAVALVHEALPRLVLTEPAMADRLRPIRAALRTWLARAGASPDIVADVVLASGEALANAIEHAYTGQPRGGTISLEARVEAPREVVVRVSDEGAWREPTVPTEDRGRGLTVMRAVMDDVELVPGRNGTVVTMRRSLPDADLASEAASSSYAAGP
jgi:serine phosphatase RsbU (regulator of sigma subunit)/anti-sigma regulatory factor (Ser/Thr protein kinase)/CHASE1-domain containing sensor protein